MNYTGNSRYQFQPWWVKLGRHLKYRPLWLRSMLWSYTKWVLRGAPKEDWHETRWQTALESYDFWLGMYDFWIGHYHTWDEVKKELELDN